MTTAESLQIMVSAGGHMVVLRSPAPEYEKHIAACRADDIAIGILSGEILDDLFEADFVKQDDCEDEARPIFRLTDWGREAVKTPLEKSPKAKLVSLGYPWPEHLEAKSIAWLEAETRAITPVA